MRLSSEYQTLIVECAKEIFGPAIRISLFGSRTDDKALGGDIDLLIQSDTAIDQSEQKSLQLAARLQIRLGDQAIDVLVIDPLSHLTAFHQEVLETSQLL